MSGDLLTKVVKMTDKTFKIDTKRFIEANKDYVKRIELEGLVMIYDATLDALFLEIGGPEKALTEPVIDNIMIRIAPATLEVVGLEIQDFVPANRIIKELIHPWSLNRNKDKEMTLVEPSALRAAKVLTEFAIQHMGINQ